MSIDKAMSWYIKVFTAILLVTFLLFNNVFLLDQNTKYKTTPVFNELDWIARVNSGIQNGSNTSKLYTSDWESLDKRPLPEWYDDAKFGIFIHWGLFSVPAFNSEWFWYRWKVEKRPAFVEFMEKNYPPDFKYSDFATQFTARMYKPDQWVKIIAESGARYVVFTSKHHDGFTNWPSKYSHGWNSVDTGPGRDLLGEFEQAVRKRRLRFGIYHSLMEWFHPLYLLDQQNKFETRHFVYGKTLPCLYELVTQYKPDLLWSDGEAVADALYWNSTDFLAWLYNDSPVKDSVVVNDRWGGATRCTHGDFLTCEDKFNPGKLQPRKWENCMTIDQQSWGYRKNARLTEYLSPEQLITTLVETVSCGGNLLMNIGPTADGLIMPIYEHRLKEVGAWMKVNRHAIRNTKPWRLQQDEHTNTVWYTEAKYTHQPTVFAIMLKWPTSGHLTLSGPNTTSDTDVTMLGISKPLTWTTDSNTVTVQLPCLTPDEFPCKYAWVIQFQNVN